MSENACGNYMFGSEANPRLTCNKCKLEFCFNCTLP